MTLKEETVGVGIVTYNRPDLFKKLFDSLQECKGFIDHLVIVEDATGPNPDHDNYIIDITKGRWRGDNTMMVITSDKNIGVGNAKNMALRHLMSKNCDHFFLIEDDIFIRKPEVFEKYIEASMDSGIQHFNYSQHGLMNKDRNGSPNPRLVINYPYSDIAFYPHCVGAFSYFTKKCLDEVGVYDERYFNACEHVDHTYQIIKADMHPPFWYFADIDKSWEYLGDEPWSLSNSTISGKPGHNEIMKKSDVIFVEKHGLLPMQIPLVDALELGKKLKIIRKSYGA